MSGWALGISAVAAVASAGYSVYAGERADSAQAKGQKKAKQAAIANEKKADEAFNAANKKTPDISSIMKNAQEAAKAGGASTMLTGPAGDTSMSLGKSSLLG